VRPKVPRSSRSEPAEGRVAEEHTANRGTRIRNIAWAIERESPKPNVKSGRHFVYEKQNLWYKVRYARSDLLFPCLQRGEDEIGFIAGKAVVTH
jgi:hypothetical protein